MKYVSMTGGLGNQMFMYAFLLNLRNKGYHAMPILLRKGARYGYHKYELPDVFEIDDSDCHEPLKLKLLRTFWLLFSFLPPSYRTRCLGITTVSVPMNFIYYPDVVDPAKGNELYKGTWQSEKYFIEAKDAVLKAFTFRCQKLSEKTVSIQKMIEGANSVSIHVRRDDYLSSSYSSGFGGICTVEYYKRAIALMTSMLDNVVFFLFTDDPQWVRDNMVVDNCVFVDHNSGSDSWQDMYLMHCCKHNIIANSTFSWWGAYLNPNPEKIVIAPRTWWNGIKDDVVPQEWIRL